MITARKKIIQSKVSELLQSNGITGAPVDVETIAANLGIVVRKTPAEDEISGFLLKQPQGGAVIGINTLHHPNRQRFTIGHEIGHFMLHDFDEVHVDKFVVRLRNEASSSGEDKEEVEANRFAAELLMPRHMLERELAQFAMNDLLDDRAMQRLAKA